MNHITHIYSNSSHVFHHNNQTQASVNHSRTINNQASHYLAQLLAQAEGSRSGEPPSPRRGLEKGNNSLTQDLA